MDDSDDNSHIKVARAKDEDIWFDSDEEEDAPSND
jgi:hypothetical protein